MTYQAKRRERFKEKLELVDKHGNAVKTIFVDLDAEDMAIAIARKYTELTKALAESAELKKTATTAAELTQCNQMLGTAVIDLFEVVFGAEDTKTILEFYENRYLEMSREILPFIPNVVIPKIAELKAKNRNEITKRYNRKRRRTVRSWF